MSDTQLAQTMGRVLATLDDIKRRLDHIEEKMDDDWRQDPVIKDIQAKQAKHEKFMLNLSAIWKTATVLGALGAVLATFGLRIVEWLTSIWRSGH